MLHTQAGDVLAPLQGTQHLGAGWRQGAGAGPRSRMEAGALMHLLEWQGMYLWQENDG